MAAKISQLGNKFSLTGGKKERRNGVWKIIYMIRGDCVLSTTYHLYFNDNGSLFIVKMTVCLSYFGLAYRIALVFVIFFGFVTFLAFLAFP